jgi:hypothetical protein
MAGTVTDTRILADAIAMGNRPHPHRRGEDPHEIAMRMARDPEFQAECDLAYRQGQALEEAERAERIRLAEESAEQRDWESDERED